MKNFLPKILFYYSALASFLITASTVFSSRSLAPVILAILFLPVTAYFVIEFFKQIRSGSDIAIGPKKGEVIAITIIFLLLTGLSLRNIFRGSMAGPAETPATPTPSPLIFKKAPTPEPKKTIQVEISDGSASINIRQAPTVYSQKVGDAKAGDVFEYNQKSMGWYEIRLDGGGVGYLSSKYAKEVTQ